MLGEAVGVLAGSAARLEHARALVALGGALQLAAVQRPKQRAGVLGQRIDQRLPGGLVLVVTDRLARRRVLVIANKQPPQLDR